MPSRHPERRFQDILDYARIARQAVGQRDKEQLIADPVAYCAVRFALLVISEAAVKLDDLAIELAPEIDWPQIRGLGNHLRHGYSIVNIDVVWAIVTTKLDELELSCRQAIAALNEPEPNQTDPKGHRPA